MYDSIMCIKHPWCWYSNLKPYNNINHFYPLCDFKVSVSTNQTLHLYRYQITFQLITYLNDVIQIFYILEITLQITVWSYLAHFTMSSSSSAAKWPIGILITRPNPRLREFKHHTNPRPTPGTQTLPHKRPYMYSVYDNKPKHAPREKCRAMWVAAGWERGGSVQHTACFGRLTNTEPVLLVCLCERSRKPQLR